MLPLLKAAAAAGATGITTKDAVAKLGDEFGLTEDEKNELLPSGRQAVINNRVGWAATYLKKGGFLEPKRRGRYIATTAGRDYLGTNPESLTNADLADNPEFYRFKVLRGSNPTDETSSTNGTESNAARSTNSSPQQDANDTLTPRERIERLYQAMNQELADEILSAVLDSSPQFFERLVVDLLVAMGYGGTHRDAGQAIGQSHDGGIDGIINEDRLGLDRVYIQAKRWKPDNTVGSPEVQKFAGALQGQRARKGVFITTSSFSSAARAFVQNIESKIVLIDGEQLGQFMIEFGIGAVTTQKLVLKRLDQDYFTEE